MGTNAEQRSRNRGIPGLSEVLSATLPRPVWAWHGVCELYPHLTHHCARIDENGIKQSGVT